MTTSPCFNNPILNFTDWKKEKCDESRPSCAFCAYAQQETDTTKVGPPCSCESNSLGASQSNDDLGIVCFNNYNDPNDKLCIFADYATGTNNLKYMNREKLSDNLQVMFSAAAAQRKDADPLVPRDVDRVCFHRPGNVSVAWTHGHFFNSAKDSSPDGVNPSNAYCVSDPLKNPKAAAESLVAMVTNDAA